MREFSHGSNSYLFYPEQTYMNAFAINLSKKKTIICNPTRIILVHVTILPSYLYNVLRHWNLEIIIVSFKNNMQYILQVHPTWKFKIMEVYEEKKLIKKKCNINIRIKKQKCKLNLSVTTNNCIECTSLYNRLHVL